jgi:vancomycin resistance protein YoaR
MSNQRPAPTRSPKTRRSFKRSFWLSVLGIIILVLVSLAGYVYVYRDKILPHSEIAGVKVGGLTQSQAEQKLAQAEASFDQKPLNLTYEIRTWSIKPAIFQPTFENTPSVTVAYSLGKSGPLWQQLEYYILALFTKHQYNLNLNPLSTSAISNLQNSVLKDVEVPFMETTIDFTPGKVDVIPGKEGRVLDQGKFIQDVAAAFADGLNIITLKTVVTQPQITVEEAQIAREEASQILWGNWTITLNNNQTITLDPKTIVPWLSTTAGTNQLNLVIDQQKIGDYLTSNVATKVFLAPVNANLTVNNNQVAITQDGQNGTSLNIASTTQAILQSFMSPNQVSRQIKAVINLDQPTISKANLSSLGINQLIGTGITDFTGSPANRIENITVGEQKINGQLVKPGAEFSTVAALGPIDEAHGYVQGLVIINNETLPEDGGGLCQVSTTLFRAVLNAGLPVTDRTSHSYEVSYYQKGIGPGLDATIYDPTPDFKWKNDTGHYIYIEGSIQNDHLTFQFYGTSDGRVSSIDGPHTLATFQPSGSPIYVNTDTLSKGTTELIDPPVPGAKTTATYTVTRNGQVINTQVFNSYYQAMPAQYLVGTK